MPENEFWKEYQKILEEHREAQRGAVHRDAFENRSHPRLVVPPKSLWSEAIPEAVVENLSASGIAIRANQPRGMGELIHVSLGSTLSVEAEVVGCRMLQSPDEFTDGEFMIQCRFLEDLKGIELMVKTIRGN